MHMHICLPLACMGRFTNTHVCVLEYAVHRYSDTGMTVDSENPWDLYMYLYF